MAVLTTLAVTGVKMNATLVEVIKVSKKPSKLIRNMYGGHKKNMLLLLTTYMAKHQ